jgi:DNA-binding LacI/PurR family transcriptional regulator
MAVVFEKDKAYMEALKTFRRLIEADYGEGGWLPPSREMAERLGVSSVTYVKVTNRLTAESVTASYPRKGIYITPQKYRPRKVGLVVNGGEESPYLGGRLVTAVLQRIEESGFEPQLIQGSPLTNIPRNALAHYVRGLIWIAPPVAAYSVIQEMHDEKLLPQIMVMAYHPASEADLPPMGIACVSEDYQAMGAKMADLFISRRHKSVLYLGNSWFAEHIGLATRLHTAGLNFNSVRYLGDSMSKPGLLKKLMKEHRPTGLIVEGREKRLETIFEELSKLPENKQPEVLIRLCPGLSEIRSRYPRVNVIGMAREGQSKAETAATMLTAHLANGEKLASRQLASYTIESTSAEAERLS